MALLAALVPLAGCSGPGAPDAGAREEPHGHGHDEASGNLPMTGEEAAVLHVRAGDPEEFRFNPDLLEAGAGSRVGVMLHNDGGLGHELAIPEADFMLHAEAGESAQAALVAPPEGEYEFGCYLPGHFEAGMKGALETTDEAA